MGGNYFSRLENCEKETRTQEQQPHTQKQQPHAYYQNKIDFILNLKEIIKYDENQIKEYGEEKVKPIDTIEEETNNIEQLLRNRNEKMVGLEEKLKAIDLDEDLKKSITECLDSKSISPSSLNEKIKKLNQLIIKIYIDDPQGRKFWLHYFEEKEYVLWEDFFVSFVKFLELDEKKTKKENKKFQKNIKYLKEIIVEYNEKTNHNVVKIEKFALLLNWSGPIIIQPLYSILDKIRFMMQAEWFYHDFTKKDADDLLSLRRIPGTYLVRTSITEKDYPFVISKVVDNRQIIHQRVHKNPSDGKLRITIGNGKEKEKLLSDDDFLCSFISLYSSELNLLTSCNKFADC